jgi:hypothetical protein
MSGLASAFVTLLLAGPALPPSPPCTAPSARGFGDTSVVVVSADLGAGGSVSPTKHLANARSAGVGLAGEVFVTGRLSFGSVIEFAYDHDRDGVTSYVYGITQRVGWAFPMGSVVSFWPRLGLSALHESRDGGDRGHEIGAFALNAFAPLEITPLSHILLGLGPSLTADLVRRADGLARPNRLSLSLTAEVAAWF